MDGTVVRQNKDFQQYFTTSLLDCNIHSTVALIYDDFFLDSVKILSFKECVVVQE